MSFNKLFILIYLILFNKSFLFEESDEKLLFVWQHFRHGARGSYKSFDYKNWKDILNVNWEGAGELTPIGMRMHYLLGVATRKKYNNFLSPEYNPNEIYIISTDVNRTLISVYSNLQGIYHQSKNNDINEKQIKRAFILNQNYSKKVNDKIKKLKNKIIEGDVKVFPVNIYNIKDLKFQLYRSEVCPGITPLLKKLRNSEGMKELYNDIYRNTNELFGDNIYKFMNKSKINEPNYLYNFNKINVICDSFICDYFDGREMKNIKNTNIDMDKFYNHCLNISLITSYYNYYGYPVEKTAELGVSPTFREIFDYMEKRISLDKNGTPDKIISNSPKFVIVSSHDVSLAGIDLFLESKFGIKFKKAEFTSSQTFELWKNQKNGEYIIKYLINFRIAKTFDFYDFKNKVSSELYSQEEIKNICFSNSSVDVKKGYKVVFYFFIILLFLSISILICLLICFIKYRKKVNKINIIKEINKIIEMKNFIE